MRVGKDQEEGSNQIYLEPKVTNNARLGGLYDLHSCNTGRKHFKNLFGKKIKPEEEPQMMIMPCAENINITNISMFILNTDVGVNV